MEGLGFFRSRGGGGGGGGAFVLVGGESDLRTGFAEDLEGAVGVGGGAEGAEGREAVGADGVREVIFRRFWGVEDIPVEVGEGGAGEEGLEDEFRGIEEGTGLLSEGEAGEVVETGEEFGEEEVRVNVEVEEGDVAEGGCG